MLFKNHPQIRRALETLADVGLGYIALGQSSPTLSGGEAQRVKLSRELVEALDGPHALHPRRAHDRPALRRHQEAAAACSTGWSTAGNTVVVIEHNLDVIKTADWVIDLGPEGGDAGGRIVAEGTPEQVAAVRASYTGRFLAPLLPRHGSSRERASRSLATRSTARRLHPARASRAPASTRIPVTAMACWRPPSRSGTAGFRSARPAGARAAGEGGGHGRGVAPVTRALAVAAAGVARRTPRTPRTCYRSTTSA